MKQRAQLYCQNISNSILEKIFEFEKRFSRISNKINELAKRGIVSESVFDDVLGYIFSPTISLTSRSDPDLIHSEITKFNSSLKSMFYLIPSCSPPESENTNRLIQRLGYALKSYFSD
jgi:hypothetical protein